MRRVRSDEVVLRRPRAITQFVAGSSVAEADGKMFSVWLNAVIHLYGKAETLPLLLL